MQAALPTILPAKAAILAQLKQDIRLLQTTRLKSRSETATLSFGPLQNAFAEGIFPQAVLHEFLTTDASSLAATKGFMLALLSLSLQREGAILWLGVSPTVFAPALHHFGIQADRVVFVDVKKEKHLLWAMEEALKCGALSSVVGELPLLDLTSSRRLQLAAEQNQVTGFILHRHYRQVGTTACALRWAVRSRPSVLQDGMPGVGLPEWEVDLLKARYGKTGSWQLRWEQGAFVDARPLTVPDIVVRCQTG